MKEHTTCIVCDRNDNEVPLINFSFKGHNLKICSQHLPVLIHEPQKLIGRLDGAENIQAG